MKEKFAAQNPKKQVITKTDLAKYRNSWLGNPQDVSKGAQTNFNEFAKQIDESWDKNDTVFNDQYFRDTVALAILFKHTEWVVSHQPWFEKGYRANIVTYSIALLHRLIKQQFKGMDLNLQLIWNRQQVPDLITNELVKITKYVFDQITDPSRGTINVTQWCKRPACWDSMKKCSIKLSDELNDDSKKLLIADEEAKAAERDAGKGQAILSDAEAQADVYNKSIAGVWKKLNVFVAQRRVNVSPNEFDALKSVIRKPNDILNPKQSHHLLELLDRAEANGFKA